MTDHVTCPHCGETSHIGGLIGPHTNDCSRCGGVALGLRLYHLVSIRISDGAETILTRYPTTHANCCNMKRRFTDHKFRRIQLKEITC